MSEILGYALNGVFLMVVVPIALIILSALIRWVADEILPQMWQTAGQITTITRFRGLLAGMYTALAVGFAIALIDAGCGRMVL